MTEIDGAKLTMSIYICKLPGEERSKHRLLISYQWEGRPEHCYSDMILFSIPDTFSLANEYYDHIDGVSMYDFEEGTAKTTRYHEFLEQKDTTVASLIGSRQVREILIKLPKEGANPRGYYAVEGWFSNEIDISYQVSDYYHRSDWFNVPYKGAENYFMQTPVEESDFFNYYCTFAID